MFYYKILLNSANQLYTYKCDKQLEKGRVVEVDFAGRCCIGVAYGQDYSSHNGGSSSSGDFADEDCGSDSSEDFSETPDNNFSNNVSGNFDDEIKIISTVYDIILPQGVIELMEFVSAYYLCGLNQALKLCLPFKAIKQVKPKKEIINDGYTIKAINKLSAGQQDVVNKLQTIGFGVSLIEGKTGSGKTEVYINQIAKILATDSAAQVLILIPEIGLSDGVFKKLTAAFNFDIVLWNSSIYEGKKQRYYMDIYNGKTQIVLGTRSALFLPFKNLKYIVVDEEHDQSYKQEENTLYHARDVAIYRAKITNCPILLLSATPSVESEFNSREQKYTKFELTERFFDVEMPDIELIDLKKDKLRTGSQFSQKVINEIDKVIKNNKQVLIFIQRRGYCPIVVCPCCFYKFECSRCDVFLSFHQKNKILKCHQCGKSRSMPSVCPSCNAKPSAQGMDFLKVGFGVERIEEELKNQFMFEPIITITSDTVSTPKKLQEAISKIENKEASIIIGTQLISKGFHFKHVDLVCILDADLGSNTVDFRGKERTYQLITQVAGRTGREINKGKVLIQTYNVNDKVLNAIQNYDSKEFYNTQLTERQKNELPPYINQIGVIISGKDKNQTIEAAHILKKQLEEIAKKAMQKASASDYFVEVLGPAEAQIFYIKERFRYRLLIIFTKNIFLQKYIKQFVESVRFGNSVNIRFDVNPYSFF